MTGLGSRTGALGGACPYLCAGTPHPLHLPATLARPQPQCREEPVPRLDSRPGTADSNIPPRRPAANTPGTCNPVRSRRCTRTQNSGRRGCRLALRRGPLRHARPPGRAPAPEVASAIVRAGQVRGCGRPRRRGPRTPWGRCSHRARLRRRQRPRPPAPAAVPACPSAASSFARAEPRFSFSAPRASFSVLDSARDVFRSFVLARPPRSLVFVPARAECSSPPCPA